MEGSQEWAKSVALKGCEYWDPLTKKSDHASESGFMTFQRKGIEHVNSKAHESQAYQK